METTQNNVDNVLLDETGVTDNELSMLQKLIVEREELKQKIERLERVLFADEYPDDFDHLQKPLLMRQHDVMCHYRNLLSLRIKHVEGS